MQHNFTSVAFVNRSLTSTRHPAPDARLVVDLATARSLRIEGMPLNLCQLVIDAIADRYAENTRFAYRRAWAAFAAWAGKRGTDPFPAPPDLVAVYTPATIRHPSSHVSTFPHPQAPRHPDTELAGPRQSYGVASRKQNAPFGTVKVLDNLFEILSLEWRSTGAP